MHKKHQRNQITTKTLAISVFFYCLNIVPSLAQLSLNGQLRPRAEVRAGFGNLTTVDSEAASFISQRTRLTFGYKWDRLTFGATLQDVRVWGQDASTISAADGGKLMLHEGWGELILANKADTTIGFKPLQYLSLKIGRQELVYDDARLIGNLDWLQQGRRFDMVLLKALHQGWQIDLGYAYNQNTDAFGVSGKNYVPGNVPPYIKNDIGTLVPTPAGMVPLTAANGNSSPTGNPTYSNPPGTNAANQNFKNFQSLYISKKIGQGKFSLLALRDAFAEYTVGSVAAGGGNVYGRIFNSASTNDRYTLGAMVNPSFGKKSNAAKVTLQAAYYLQAGKDRDGKDLTAYHYTLSGIYNKGKFSIGPGIDVLSGNKSSTPGTESKRFDPLYGTPHKFWGHMDYFYTGTSSPVTGLLDYYVKSKYSATEFFITADYHHFNLQNKITGVLETELGNEIDLAANYNLNKFSTVEIGYSVMFANTDVMAAAKGQSNKDLNKTGRWGYLMINIRPDFLYKRP